MASGQQPYNILRNGDFDSWSEGDSSNPDSWIMGGAGGTTIAKEDTGVRIYGSYAAKLKTNVSGGIATLRQDQTGLVLSKRLKQTGDTLYFGAWVKADTDDRVRLYIYDGVNPAWYSASYATSTYQFLTMSHTFAGSRPTHLYVGIEIAANGTQVTAWIDGAICVVGGEIYGFMPNPLDIGGEVYGDLTFKGGKTVKGIPDPTADQEAATKGYVDALLQTPSGSIIMYGGATAPTGWLLCDGAAISRTTYSALFTAIGTTYGVGDGSTTFNVPDIRGIFPRGAGTHGSLVDAASNHFVGVLGLAQNDSFQGHGHKLYYITKWTGGHGDNRYGMHDTWQGNYLNVIKHASTDGTHGIPRTAIETKPANIGVTYIIKT